MNSFLYFVLLTITIINSNGTLGRSIRHLDCNSANQIRDDTNFIYITSKNEDCTFLFEAPSESGLDIKIQGLTENSPCKFNKNVKIYDYKIDSFIVMEESICGKGSYKTDSNMGIIRSTGGSFIIRIKATNGLNNSILGMNAPFESSRDFFKNDLRADETFKPSLGVPAHKPLSTSYGAPLSTSYGAPLSTSYGAPLSTLYGAPQNIYQGKPGQIIELTTLKPEEVNETITTHGTTVSITSTGSSKPTSQETTTMGSKTTEEF